VQRAKHLLRQCCGDTTRASGHAERLAGLALIEPYAEQPQRVTLAPTRATTSVTSSWNCAIKP
jgi:hypothetical protein